VSVFVHLYSIGVQDKESVSSSIVCDYMFSYRLITIPTIFFIDLESSLLIPLHMDVQYKDEKKTATI